ncbi:MAG: glycosyltransferase [archaeon]|jgi:hypothetical protein
MQKMFVQSKQFVADSLAPYLKRPVFNYFKANHKKNVLISYIVSPFRKGINLKHTNFAESLEIAKVFDSLGYNVDVYNYDFDGKINYGKYAVLFGFGNPLENYFFENKKSATVVHYATGMHESYQNLATLKRAKELYRRRGTFILQSSRLVGTIWPAQTFLSDYIIALGNKSVANSYKKDFAGKIFSLPLSFYDVLDLNKVFFRKNFVLARKHILWFGGFGAVHKGLDVLLEAFKGVNDVDLHICGYVNQEFEFLNEFKKELSMKNIHNHGFVSVDSKEFLELMRTCGFVIFPSCSEGGSASVINCMANGLVPVVTESSGIDTKGFGFEIKDVEISSLRTKIKELASISPKKLELMSKKCAAHVHSNNSISAYSKRLRQIMLEILE